MLAETPCIFATVDTTNCEIICWTSGATGLSAFIWRINSAARALTAGGSIASSRALAAALSSSVTDADSASVTLLLLLLLLAAGAGATAAAAALRRALALRPAAHLTTVVSSACTCSRSRSCSCRWLLLAITVASLLGPAAAIADAVTTLCCPRLVRTAGTARSSKTLNNGCPKLQAGRQAGRQHNRPEVQPVAGTGSSLNCQCRTTFVLRWLASWVQPGGTSTA